MSTLPKDCLLGALVAAFSLVYIGYARSIEDSLLADSVGASGVPLALGIALFIAAAALAVKSYCASAAEAEATEDLEPAGNHLTAATLVAMLLAYVLVVPVAGYMVSVSLLVLAVALLARAALKPALFIGAALSGGFFWLLFEWALGIHMPDGILFS